MSTTLHSPGGIPPGYRLDAQRAIACALERMGWQMLAVDVDMVAETARIEVKRRDGLLVTLDARIGSASITREMMRTETTIVGRRGDRFLAERLRYEFLGRQRYTGVRSATRGLCYYLAENATTTALSAYDVRNLFRYLLATGTQR